MTPAAHAALTAHDAAFIVGSGLFGDVPVVATVDRLGSPAVVTYLGVSGDGEPAYGRFTSDLGVQATIQDHLASAPGGRQSMPFSEVLDWFGARNGIASFGDHYAASFFVRNPGVDIDEQDLLDAADANLLAAGAPDVAGRLDREALEALAAVRSHDVTPYLFYAAEGERGQTRRQQAAIYPLLAADMAARTSVKLAIDRRKPIVEALERAYGADEAGTPFLTKPLQKRLQKLDYPDHDIPIEVLVRTLGQVPPDWFPRDRDNWDAFCKLTKTGFRYFAPAIGERPDRLCPGAAGKWADVLARTAKSAASTLPPAELSDEEKRAWRPVPDTSQEGIDAAFNGAFDMLRAFRDQVVYPAAVSEAGDDDVPLGPESKRLATEAAARILFSGKSLSAIMEMQRDWHVVAPKILEVAGTEREPELRRGVAKGVATDGWAPLCDIWQAPNGVTIVPLTDPRELADEGAGGYGNGPCPDRNGIMGLGHCVGTYTAGCKSGDSHIVSFRVYEGEDRFRRLSTAEFTKLTPDTDRLKCRQHHGTNNGAAPKLAKEAFSWFVEEVAAQRIPLNRDGIMTFLSGKPVITDEIQRKAGYDRRDVELVGRVAEAWGQFLPKRLRGAGVDAIRECPEMERLVEALVPRYSSGLRF